MQKWLEDSLRCNCASSADHHIPKDGIPKDDKDIGTKSRLDSKYWLSLAKSNCVTVIATVPM